MSSQVAGRVMRRRSQFEALQAIFDRFNAELSKVPHEKARAIAINWGKFKEQQSDLLANRASGITRSKLSEGMKQGLRETPLILAGFPKEVHAPLLRVFRKITAEEMPGFFDFEREKLARVLERGRLRNEADWHLARHRVDEIQGDSTYQDELTLLLELLDAYERR